MKKNNYLTVGCHIKLAVDINTHYKALVGIGGAISTKYLVKDWISATMDGSLLELVFDLRSELTRLLILQHPELEENLKFKDFYKRFQTIDLPFKNLILDTRFLQRKSGFSCVEYRKTDMLLNNAIKCFKGILQDTENIFPVVYELSKEIVERIEKFREELKDLHNREKATRPTDANQPAGLQ